MTSQDWQHILDGTPFGGAGMVTAAVLILLVRLFVPKSGKWIRWPLFFLLLHMVLVIASHYVPARRAARAYVEYIGLFLLLASIARSGFLLVMHSAVSQKLTKPFPKIFQDILQGLIYGIAVLITLREAGVEPGSLLTTSALLTAVIGLSLQDTLGNMFAGLAIQAQRPFDVGDWIQFDNDPKHIGQVTEINWRATRVLTQDQLEVTVPNATLARAPISNFSKPTPMLRSQVVVVAPYDQPPRRIRDIMERTLKDIPGVRTIPEPSIVAADFPERGVEYRVRYFMDDYRNKEQLDSLVRERVWYALQRSGVNIPVPTRNVFTHEINAQSEARQLESEFLIRRDALMHVDFLSALPNEALQKLAELSETRLYGPGEIVIRQGEAGNELFVIRKGAVEVIAHASEQKDVVVARLEESKFFGEMSLMTGAERTATVRALEPCEMIVVGKTAFQQILRAMPELAQQISEILAARRQELDLRVHSEAARPMSQDERRGILLARIRKFFAL